MVENDILMENEEPKKCCKNFISIFLFDSLFSAKIENSRRLQILDTRMWKMRNQGILVKVPRFLLLKGFNFWIQAYRKWDTKDILKIPKFNSSKLVPHFPHFTDLLTLTTSMKRMRHQWEKSTKSRYQSIPVIFQVPQFPQNNNKKVDFRKASSFSALNIALHLT